MRRGVSLIEVLMSIFVLSIGVLGIFAMLSLGHRMEREIDRHDNVAACGKACIARVAQRDTEYQEFCRPSEPMLSTFPITGWTSPDVGRFFYNGNLFPSTTQPNDTDGLTGPVLVDPIGYARNAGTDFPPANAAEPRQLLSDTTNPLTVSLPRITPRTWGTPTKTDAHPRVPMPLAMADRLFSWSDDVTTPVPDDGSRPKHLYYTDASGNPLHGQSQGNYTWSVFLRPTDEMLGLTGREQMKFLAYVLIYQRRNIEVTTPPVERTVICNVLGGSGDCKLTTTVGPDYLDIKKDRWLLLVGVDNLRRLRCEWYQIRMIDLDATAEAPGRWAVYASLRGPDWPVYDPIYPNAAHWLDKKRYTTNPALFTNEPFDLDGDGNACDVLAIIMDDLVGVRLNDGRSIDIQRY
jgi:hypothetical protein